MAYANIHFDFQFESGKTQRVSIGPLATSAITPAIKQRIITFNGNGSTYAQTDWYEYFQDSDGTNLKTGEYPNSMIKNVEIETVYETKVL